MARVARPLAQRGIPAEGGAGRGMGGEWAVLWWWGVGVASVWPGPLELADLKNSVQSVLDSHCGLLSVLACLTLV